MPLLDDDEDEPALLAERPQAPRDSLDWKGSGNRDGHDEGKGHGNGVPPHDAPADAPPEPDVKAHNGWPDLPVHVRFTDTGSMHVMEPDGGVPESPGRAESLGSGRGGERGRW